jgi:hypothetical protein
MEEQRKFIRKPGWVDRPASGSYTRWFFGLDVDD